MKIECGETFMEVDLRDHIDDYNFQETREGALSKVSQHFGIRKSAIEHAEFACRYAVSVQKLCGQVTTILLVHQMNYHPEKNPTISDRADVRCFVSTPEEQCSGTGIILHTYKYYKAHQNEYEAWVKAYDRAPTQKEANEILKQATETTQDHLDIWYTKMKDMMRQ